MRLACSWYAAGPKDGKLNDPSAAVKTLTVRCCRASEAVTETPPKGTDPASVTRPDSCRAAGVATACGVGVDVRALPLDDESPQPTTTAGNHSAARTLSI